jgi:iron complex transport system ATP-binding protein
LLDEPLQQMDVKHQMSALKLISEVQNLGNTIVMSHHDINQSMRYCSHICLIKDGKVTQDGPRDEVINRDSMQRLFSQGFKVLNENQGNNQYFMPE